MNMQKGLGVLGLATSMLLAAPMAHATFIIDDFETTSGFSVTDLTADGVAGIQGTGVSLGTTIDATNTVMGVLGGAAGWNRTIYAELDFVDAVSTQVCPTCDAGHLASGAGGASGNASFIYTGTALDLSAYTGTTLDIAWAADQAGATLMVTFTDSGALTDTYIFPNTPNTGSSSIANLVSAGGVNLAFVTVDETQITGVRIDILGVADLDATIDQIPLPGTLALLGLGLAGFGWRSRKA